MKRYNDIGSWLAKRFPLKVQKISIDGGFTCPNRDGRLGTSGCTFCNNQTFAPFYTARGMSIAEQVEAGKRFFGHKYTNMRYLAYFQTYSNTYAPLNILKARYEEALSQDGIEGLIVGTRPDCLPDKVLDYLAELSNQTFLLLEIGVESVNDNTLQRIQRRHTHADSVSAIVRAKERNLLVGAHAIIGLPGEDHKAIIQQAETLSQLPIDILKLHQLQIIRGTQLAEEYKQNRVPILSLEEYIVLLGEYIRHLSPSMVLDRFVSQSPQNLLIAPHWGIKNGDFVKKFDHYLTQHDYRQGDLQIVADSCITI